MRHRLVAFIFMAALMISLPAIGNFLLAQESQTPDLGQKPQNELTIAGVVVQAKGDASDKNEDKDTPKPIKDVLPDAKKIDGLIPMYLKKDRLLAEITGSNLNTDYLIAMAIAKGSGSSAIGGYTIGFGDDWLWQFRKVNDRIQVVRRNIRFMAESGTPEEKAVEIAYSDSILYSLPIIAKGEKGGDVIDLDAIFMSDLPKIGSSMGASFAGNRSTWGDVKGFENNMEIQVAATYSGGYFSGADSAPDGSSIGVTIHYSVSKLPSSGYSPRLADDRIGYFTTAHKNFSKNQDDDHMVRYINRWNLQKADSNAALSPPKKPVIFWVEKTVPFKYRNAVREGILEWNKAYEKVGIVNAIEVRQQSEKDTWDPEDINYNTFRWITSDAGFAMGPSHVNPLNGEILDADIIMDAGFVDSWKKKFDIFITESMPVVSKERSKKEQIQTLLGLQKKAEALEHDHQCNHDAMNHCTCKYAENMASQIAFASLALALLEEEGDSVEEGTDKEEPKAAEGEEAKEETKENGDKKDEEKEKKSSKEELKKKSEEAFEKLVLAGIKDVVMHEVGHTLGLRHNFKASSWLTLEEINSPERSKEFGFVGSVMDYVPVNIMPKGRTQGDYFMPTLGPYDYLAIEYGYKSLSGGTEGETKELQKIATKQAEKGHHYATDEDVPDGGDPLTIRFDLGKNPIDFAKVSTELYNQLLPELVDRAAKEGESYKDVGFYFRVVLFNRIQANYFLARNIGGLYRNRDHRGDADGRPPVQVIDANTQRESLKYLCDEIFATDSFRIPAELYNQFGAEKWLDWNWDTSGGSEMQLRDLLLGAQLNVLRAMINPTTLSRLDDMEMRVNEGEDVFTIIELFDTLTPAIFRELEALKEGDFSAQKPAIHLTRRNLQEYYFLFLAEYASGSASLFAGIPESCQSIPRQQLITLSSNIQAVLAGKAKLDPASKAHLVNINERIQKVLNSRLEQMMP